MSLPERINRCTNFIFKKKNYGFTFNLNFVLRSIIYKTSTTRLNYQHKHGMEHWSWTLNNATSTMVLAIVIKFTVSYNWLIFLYSCGVGQKQGKSPKSTDNRQ